MNLYKSVRLAGVSGVSRVSGEINSDLPNSSRDMDQGIGPI